MGWSSTDATYKVKTGSRMFQTPRDQVTCCVYEKNSDKLNFGEIIKLEKEPKDIYKFLWIF